MPPPGPCPPGEEEGISGLPAALLGHQDRHAGGGRDAPTEHPRGGPSSGHSPQSSWAKQFHTTGRRERHLPRAGEHVEVRVAARGRGQREGRYSLSSPGQGMPGCSGMLGNTAGGERARVSPAGTGPGRRRAGRAQPVSRAREADHHLLGRRSGRPRLGSPSAWASTQVPPTGREGAGRPGRPQEGRWWPSTGLALHCGNTEQEACHHSGPGGASSPPVPAPGAHG